MTSLVADYSSSDASSGSEANDADNMFSDGDGDDEKVASKARNDQDQSKDADQEERGNENEDKGQQDDDDNVEDEEENNNHDDDDDDDNDDDDDDDDHDDDDDDDEDEDDENEENEESNKLTKQQKQFIVNHKLPLPTPDFNSASTQLKTSVFTNPFVEAEKAKSAILEKHVKMTPTLDDTKMINGKKICWNYRKGRCRFGHNCTFAHDSDIHRNSSGLETVHKSRRGRRRSNGTSSQDIVICQTNFNHQIQSINNISNYNQNDDSYDNDNYNDDDGDDDNYEEINDQENNVMQKRKKKKRPGLSQTLIPGKRVFKIYKAQADISR